MRPVTLVLVLALVSPLAAQRQEGTLGYYRYPALSGNLVVFAAEGDLWSVSTEGGVARRLTTHAAEETNPVISPDGKTLAFTARYEGPAEVYTMPLSGGTPTRWTRCSSYRRGRSRGTPDRSTTWANDSLRQSHR